MGVQGLALEPTGRRVLLAYLRAVALAEPVQRELAARHGISLADLYAVRVLARQGEVPISRYGDELGVPRSTITNLVDRLERAGLVERLPSPTDRRITLVRLAPAGQKAVEGAVVLRDSEVAARLLALEPAAQAMLAELLERVVAGPSEGNSSDSSEAEATR
jgi:DNA-binding MarR family transcriptional regulator